MYDWIGRATEKEFVGFYTNAYYTGVFTLTPHEMMGPLSRARAQAGSWTTISKILPKPKLEPEP